jgi:RNA polymerase sigma-70 factor, ECF subfamily
VNNKQNQSSWTGISEGDSQAWRMLLDEVIGRLYGMFLKSWANPSLAEELVQKTVFDAVRGRKTYDSQKGTAEEWIFGIARNNIRLEIRKRAARPSVDGDIGTYLELIDTEPMPDEVLENKETVDIVRNAMAGLDEKERTVLKAKYLEGLSASEIAQRLEITEKAVHDLLYRARNSLRDRLKRLARSNIQEQEQNET